jgi:hypothetical protein
MDTKTKKAIQETAEIMVGHWKKNGTLPKRGTTANKIGATDGLEEKETAKELGIQEGTKEYTEMCYKLYEALVKEVENVYKENTALVCLPQELEEIEDTRKKYMDRDGYIWKEDRGEEFFLTGERLEGSAKEKVLATGELGEVTITKNGKLLSSWY